VRLSVPGLLAGLVAGSLTLLPTVQALIRGELPRIAPSAAGDLPPFFGNLIKSSLYWFRLGSLDSGRRLRHGVTGVEDALAGSVLLPGVRVLLIALVAVAVLSIAVSIAASWDYFRRPTADPGEGGGERDWVRFYALSFLLAVVISGAVAPVTVQAWHFVIALHAACIPVALWVEVAVSGRRSALRAVCIVFLALMPVVGMIGSLGTSMYRPRHGVTTSGARIPTELEPLFRSAPQ
jgi:hypothetical protein